MLGELCTSNTTRPRASTTNRRPRAPTSASPSEIRATITKFLATLKIRATLKNDEVPGLTRSRRKAGERGLRRLLIVGGTFASPNIQFSSQISNESQMFHLQKHLRKMRSTRRVFIPVYTRCQRGHILRYPARGLGGPPTS